MLFERFIAFRIYKGTKKNPALPIISVFASIVMIVAVFSFFLILCVFDGLREFVSNSSSPDLLIESKKERFIDYISNDFGVLENMPEIQAFSFVFSQEMALSNKNQTVFSNVLGVDKSFEKIFPNANTYKLFDSNIISPVVIGAGLLSRVGSESYRSAEGLSLLVPKANPPTALEFPFKRLRGEVVDVFQFGDSADDNTLLMSLEDVCSFMGVEKGFSTSVYLKLKNGSSRSLVKKNLEKQLGDGYSVKTKEQQNPALYKMLKTEKVIVVFILSLVVIISIFNVFSSVVLTVFDKKESIKTLKMLGSENSSLRNIFFLQGIGISLGGGLVGFVLSFLLVLVQKKFKLVFIPETSIPYPVAIELYSILILFAVVGFVSVVCSKIASKTVNLFILNSN